jgi:hypothetical protein
VIPPLKWDILGVVCALMIVFGYWLGGKAPTAALERLRAEQAQAATQALLAQRAEATAQADALNSVVEKYDAIKDLEPVSAGVVERLRLLAPANCRPVPGAPTVAGGTDPAGGIPGSPPEADRLLQAALDAASRDARRLDALIQLAPK